LKFSTAILIRRHARQDVRRKQFEFEDEFGPKLGTMATVFNLPPNAPAAQPRFAFVAPPVNLTVSDVAAQLTFQLGGPVPSKPPTSAELSEWASQLHRGFNKIYSGQRKWYSGVILVAEFPKGLPDFEISSLGAVLFKPALQDHISSFSAIVAYRRAALNYAFEVAQYISYIRTGAAPPEPITIDEDFDPPAEEGVSVKVDVNNKPQKDEPPSESNLSYLFAQTVGIVKNDLPQWLGTDRADRVRRTFGMT
jgi:hypothetical protein